MTCARSIALKCKWMSLWHCQPRWTSSFYNYSFALPKLVITSGAFSSLGLMHLTKKGWHDESVLMRRSRDFLNCSLRVWLRRRVEDCFASFKSEKQKQLPAVRNGTAMKRKRCNLAKSRRTISTYMKSQVHLVLTLREKIYKSDPQQWL